MIVCSTFQCQNSEYNIKCEMNEDNKGKTKKINIYQ